MRDLLVPRFSDWTYPSVSKEEETEESDLDLAILLDKPADTIKLWDLAQKIATRIQREVDLIDLLAATTVFCFQIISTAKRIDNQNLQSCDSFEDLSYSMYLRLNEQRKEILDEIKNRGRIY